jgi:hypothetical protein
MSTKNDAIKQLADRIRAELKGPSPVEKPTRAEVFDDSSIVDILERRHLSLAARALLAWTITRAPGSVTVEELDHAIGADRVLLYRTLGELEQQGFAKRTDAGGWQFSLVADLPPNVA